MYPWVAFFQWFQGVLLITQNGIEYMFKNGIKHPEF